MFYEALGRFKRYIAVASRHVSLWDCGLIVVILAGFAIRIHALPLPGPQGDEVYMPFVAMKVHLREPTWHPSIRILGYEWPVTIGPYTGALPVYIYLALFQFTDYSLIFRVVNVVYAIIAVFFIYQFTRDFANARTALFAASLLAIMPASVFYSRIGEYAGYLRLMLSTALLYFSYRFYMTRKWGYLFGGCLVMGLGLSVRLEMVWWVPALTISWLILANRYERLQLLKVVHSPRGWRRLLLGLTFFVVGSSLFWLYMLGSNGGRELFTLILENLRVTTAGHSNLVFLQNLRGSALNLLALIDGSSLWETGAGKTLKDSLSLRIFVLAFIWLTTDSVIGRWQKQPNRKGEFLLLTTSIMLIQSTVTLSILKPWHLLIFLPLPILMMAMLLDAMFSRLRIVGIVAFVAVVASNVTTDMRHYNALLSWEGTGGLSPEIYHLTGTLQERGVDEVVTGEWGLARKLYYLSRGEIKTTEIYVYKSLEEPMPAWFYRRLDEMLQKPIGYYLFYAYSLGDTTTHGAFVGYLESEQIKYEREVFRDKYGPLFHLYKTCASAPIQFLGYTIAQRTHYPGDTMRLALHWKALSNLDENYSVFVHLLDKDHRLWGQGDEVYPTMNWTVGELISRQHKVAIPPNAPSGRYYIEVGIYTMDNMQRFTFLDENLDPLETTKLGPIKVVGREARLSIEALEVQYPARVNLGNQVTFLGYDLEDKTLKPGDTLHIDLYWLGQKKMDRDYTVFVHLLDKEGHLVAQRDNQPKDGAYPTSIWDEGEIVKDEYALPVPSGLSTGEYKIEIGMYLLPTMERLWVVGEDGQAEEDRILLNEIFLATEP